MQDFTANVHFTGQPESLPAFLDRLIAEYEDGGMAAGTGWDAAFRWGVVVRWAEGLGFKRAAAQESPRINERAAAAPEAVPKTKRAPRAQSAAVVGAPEPQPKAPVAPPNLGLF